MNLNKDEGFMSSEVTVKVGLSECLKDILMNERSSNVPEFSELFAGCSNLLLHCRVKIIEIAGG